jgi:ribonuclease-3
VRVGQGASAASDVDGAEDRRGRTLVGAGGLTYPVPPAALASFCDRLAYEFTDPDLLGRSLTHRSWCAEHAGFSSNERLEFLGDSVLGMIVTDEIYQRHHDADEGQLSRIRASVVCAPALAEMGQELGLGEVLLLGKGEAASGGRDRPSILADAVEAVIGAVFLDGGLEAAQLLVGRLVSPRLVSDGAGSPDHKSLLHELVAQQHDSRIRYDIVEAGPEHDKTFEAIVYLDEQPLGAGHGRSKKQAEQAAARQAWRQLDQRDGDRAGREEPGTTDG